MYKYKLPNSDGQPVDYESTTNSLVIIGANGAGKSKLGAWMENNDMEKIHRVGAQRALNFGDYIQLKSYEQALNFLTYGQEQPEQTKGARWGYYDNAKYTTTLLNDYENVLAALIAKKNNQNDIFIDWCKDQERKGSLHCSAPLTVVDDVQRIWDSIFPQRQIKFDDAKVTALFSDSNEEEPLSYLGKDMSDGERVVLYLVAQCLCIPSDRIIIIDEPEIHLHRSIMNKLWTALENEREDCFFVYITHDTQFAANHVQSKKVWIKSYDGKNKWEWEPIEDSNLPEQLLLDILGNRKSVIFVEGTNGSYDFKLYSEIYKNYHVIPCGSCSNVIMQTKAMSANNQLHHLKAYGIIDRDYRVDYELDKLKEDNIYSISVAEVENLFLVEELLNIVNVHMGNLNSEKVNTIKKYVINDRFANQITKQICEATVAQIKFKLATADISKANETSAKETLDSIFGVISYDTIRVEVESKYNGVAEMKEYAEVLKIFNYKDISNSIGRFFGLNNNEYRDLVLRLIKTDKRNDLINAIATYLPPEIER